MAVNFDLVNPVMQAWVKEHGLEMAKIINGTTQEYLQALKPAIADAITAGASHDTIAEMLAGEFDKLSTTRAQLIARTETMASVNAGQAAVYKVEGVEKKEWLATIDNETRDSHAAMDGVQVPIDEPFDVDGEQMMQPGDAAGGPGNTCNCRCTVMPVLEKE